LEQALNAKSFQNFQIIALSVQKLKDMCTDSGETPEGDGSGAKENVQLPCEKQRPCSPTSD